MAIEILNHDQIGFHEGNMGRDYQTLSTLMDAAANAKAASIIPHIENTHERSVIVDAGAGTGVVGEIIAGIFRESTVYALDLSDDLEEIARNSRRLTRPVHGDASMQNFQDNSVSVKIFSTCLHEVFSYQGRAGLISALDATLTELESQGRIIIREFAKPDGQDPILMRINESGGVDSSEEATVNGILDYGLLSKHALFRRFHQEFAGGNAFEYEVVDISGETYIKLLPQWAAEFYLRKDYTTNWRQEMEEQYCFWSKAEARQDLGNSGFLNITAIDDPNEFILNKRLKGKIELFSIDASGKITPIEFPTTHMIVIGDKAKTDLTYSGIPGAITNTQEQTINYQEIIDSIQIDESKETATISDQVFAIDLGQPVVKGSKKVIYHLKDFQGAVIKIARTDTLSIASSIRAMYQSIAREQLLTEFGIPHLTTIETDHKGPPYRYCIQETTPKDALSAAQLLLTGELSEEDVAQMASYINAVESTRMWQLDTNPFNWFKTKNTDGTTTMKYVDGKVYAYDEKWDFGKIGLLQWTSPEYILDAVDNSSAIPTLKQQNAFRDNWRDNTGDYALWWKAYLLPELQPKNDTSNANLMDL